MFDISILPVVVATVAAMVIGMVWYSPKVFGVIWAKEANLDTSSPPEGMWKMVLASVLQNFVIIYVLAHFIALIRAYHSADPFVIAIWAVVLVVTSQLSVVLWEKRSLTYFMLNAGYVAVMLLAAASIIIKWPWA